MKYLRYLNRFSVVHFVALALLTVFALAIALTPVAAEIRAPKKATNAPVEYTEDGYELAETFLLRNAETNLYLKAISKRKIRLREYKPNDVTFLWMKPNATGGIYKPSEGGIFSAWDGLAISGNGDVGMQGFTDDQNSDHWVMEENPNRKGEFMIVHPPAKVKKRRIQYSRIEEKYLGGDWNTYIEEKPGAGALRAYDGRTIVRNKHSFADRKYVWILEKPPGNGRDKAIIRIDSVQAIKTSTGMDAATDALFTAIDIAAEYGSTIASGGAALAKTAAQKLAKRAADKALRAAARAQVVKLGKKSFERGLKLSLKHSAQRVAKKAAKDTWQKSLKNAVKNGIIKAAGDAAVEAAKGQVKGALRRELIKAALIKASKKAAKEARNAAARAAGGFDAEQERQATAEVYALILRDIAKKTKNSELKRAAAELALAAQKGQTEPKSKINKVNPNSNIDTGDEYPYKENNAAIADFRVKKEIYLSILSNPETKLTVEDLGGLLESLDKVDRVDISRMARSLGTKDELKNKQAILKNYLLHQYFNEYKARADIKMKPVAETPLTAHPLYKNIKAEAAFELVELAAQLATAYAKYENGTTSEQGIADLNVCAYEKPFAPIYRNIVTRGALEKLPKKGFDSGLPESGSWGAIGGKILLDAVDPAALTNAIKKFAKDTPDDLEIKFGNMSVWPNGGGSWRTIKMHEVKDVGVEVVFDRQKGVHIQLKERDSGSSNDSLGWLEFDTDDLVGKEVYKRAYIKRKAEGSIYIIDFSIRSLNGRHKTVEACARQSKMYTELSRAIQKFEIKIVELEEKRMQLKLRIDRFFAVPQAILKKYGADYFKLHNGLLAASKVEVSCPADTADYGKLLAGDWRVGVYDNAKAEKLGQTLTTYSFSADGSYYSGFKESVESDIAVEHQGKWSKVPNACKIKTSEGTLVVSGEKDGLALYTENKHAYLRPLKLLALEEYLKTQFTDEYGVLQLGPTEAHAYRGYGRWMEKITDNPVSAAKINEFKQTAAADIVGVWDVEKSKEHRWTFTSDNLLVSSIKVGGAFKAITGRWKYIGDKRVDVVLDDAFSSAVHGEFFSSIGKEFRLYVTVEDKFGFNTNFEKSTNLEGHKTGEYWPENKAYVFPPHQDTSSHFYVQKLPLGGKQSVAAVIDGRKSAVIIGRQALRPLKYEGIDAGKAADETMDVLMALRKELNLPVPEAEVEELEKFLAARALNVKNAISVKLINDDLARRDAKRAELKPLWEKAYPFNKIYDDEPYARNNSIEYRNDLRGICGRIGTGNKHKLHGKWNISLHDAVGVKTSPAGANGVWTFNPDGTVSGSFDGKAWSAKWSEIDRCTGEAVFDAQTANNYNLETEITLQVRFSKNGDRRLFVMEHAPEYSIEKTKLESVISSDVRLDSLTDANPRTKLKLKPRVYIDDGLGSTAFRLAQTPLKDIVKQRLETQAELQLRKLKSGDRKIYTFDAGSTAKGERVMVEDEILVADGRYDPFKPIVALTGTSAHDPEDKLRFHINYSELNVKRAGVANRCSARWVNGKLGADQVPKGRSIGFDVKSISGPSYTQWATVTIYRVNLAGPDAQEVYRGSVGNTGRLNQVSTHKFSGVTGDEFVVLDRQNKCVGTFKSADFKTTPARSEFKFGGINTAHTKFYYNNNLTPRTKAQGCEVHQWAETPLIDSRNRATVERLIGNTNLYDIFVYTVDDDGHYPSQKPIMTVKPGELKSLKTLIDTQYTIYKADFTCEGVAKISSKKENAIDAWNKAGSPQSSNPYKIDHGLDNKQIIFGDDSTPIDHPDYLNPAQLDSGCLYFGKTASIKNDNSKTLNLANSGSSDISVHWIGYDGKFDKDRTIYKLKPGQTGQLIDFRGAKYQLLDEAGNCAGIVDLRKNGPTKTIGDGSTAITGKIIDRFEFTGIKPAVNLSKHQIANSCSAFGKIASKPDYGNVWGPTIKNAGTKPLTVHWVSFYGTLENSEGNRDAKPMHTIKPGEEVYLNRFTENRYGNGDVLAVLDGDKCVGILTANDRFVADEKTPSRVKQSLDSRKTHYVLRDQEAADAFDVRVINWFEDIKTHKAKIAELNALSAKSTCGDKYSVQGQWQIAEFDKGGRKLPVGTPPISWNFKEFGISGTGLNGKAFSNGSSIDKCIVEANIPDGDTTKLIFNADGSKELFVTADERPDILYLDGSLRSEYPVSSRERRLLELDKKWITESHLKLWGKMLPTISSVSDVDRAANQVNEDAPIGAKVGVTASASDANDEVTYEFYSYIGASLISHDKLFAIDAKTGVVTVVGKLDYETAASHILEIRATSGDGTSTSMNVTLAIIAVNDNAVGAIINAHNPNIVLGPLYETAKIGTHVSITAQATDADTGDVVSYSLSDSSGGLFAIDSKTGVITTAGKLDWETATSHTIEVTAKSSDGSTSRKNFVIPILDANKANVGEVRDSNRQPNAVDETAPIGTKVGLTALATDVDTTDTVKYSLADTHWTAFAIDPQTGVLTLIEALGHDEYDSLGVNIVATSSDGSKTNKVFTIVVNDVNEFAVSEISNSMAYYGIQLREDAKVGSKINLNVNARDTDRTDEVTFSIANGRSLPFRIDPESGEVTVSKAVGEVANFVLEIVATSTDGSVSRKKFNVPVENFNNFSISKISDSDAAKNAIAENAPRGTPVGITAFAADDDVNDTISYSIQTRSVPFEIDAKTGVVTVCCDLDFEKKNQYTLEIYASSSDGSGSSGGFVVDIYDINESELTHISDMDNAEDSVDEGAAIGTPVGITAFARDDDSTDTVTYSLVNDADGRFAIDPKTGVVTLAGEVDYESFNDPIPQYFIDINAVSSDGSKAMDYLYRTVKIRDVNEFDISIVSDVNDAPNEVDERAEYGTPVGITAYALDGDGDPQNTEISYIIVDANGQLNRSFNIDAKGVVTVSDLSRIDATSAEGQLIRIKAMSVDGSSSIAAFPFRIIAEERWYNNPEGSRIETDFTKVTDEDRKKCVAADDDFKSPSTYNNEVEYFDCLQRHTPIFANWYDSPLYPNILKDLPNVPSDHVDACYEKNENESLPAIFNNEDEFIRCLERYVPPFINWYDNPQWPNLLNEYPLVPEDHIDVCYANNENENIKIAFNNEPEFVRCIQRYVPPKPQFVNWYNNPQWPNVQNEIPQITSDHIDACYADNENENLPAVFNNEVEFVNCIRRFVPPAPTFVNWYENPQWPNILTENPQVAVADVDTCFDNNENEGWPDTFNNEAEFVRCIQSFAPTQQAPVEPAPEEKWYNNPQTDYRDADFPYVSEADRAMCVARDERKDTPDTYNNEEVYFQCLSNHNYAPEAPANDNTNQQVDQTSNPTGRPPELALNIIANGCYDQREASQYLNDKETLLTIQNINSGNLHVYWVNYEGQNTDYDGAPAAQAIIEPGETMDITSARGFVFSALREDGSCAGVAKTRESRNNFSF